MSAEPVHSLSNRNVIDNAVVLGQQQQRRLQNFRTVSCQLAIQISARIKKTAGDRVQCKGIMRNELLPFGDLSKQSRIVKWNRNVVLHDFKRACQIES